LQHPQRVHDLDQGASRPLPTHWGSSRSSGEGIDMSAGGPEASLFDRIGGVAGVTRMISQFYARVLADPDLGPYFDGVAVHKLRHMQFEFFSAALGGPVPYTGRTVIHAHQGRHIAREHFQAFVDHLFETLKAYDLSDDERYAIIARINTYADDVIGIGGGGMPE
jgi:hemoglobin